MSSRWITDLIDNLKALLKVPPVFVDGGLYAMSAVFIFLQTAFGNDEAAKYVHETMLFWMRVFTGAMAQFFLALKMFRSNSYAQHLEGKKDETTQLIRKQIENG